MFRTLWWSIIYSSATHICARNVRSYSSF